MSYLKSQRIRVERFNRNIKKSFKKKRNQRKAIYIACGLIITLLGFSTIALLDSKQTSNDKHYRILKDRQNRLESLTQQVQEVKLEKQLTEQQKVQKEAELQKQIDELNKQLQAKAEAKRLASVRAAVRPTLSYARIPLGNSSGNLYDRGWCTWYAKNRRPDLPNNLGNAITWVSRAKAQGIPTGSSPRAGAIGQRGNHVVYIERVNPDGSVYYSDMNGIAGFNNVGYATVSASTFTYIY